eukprot:SAG11_NODE_34893_length_269_cov_1.200000_1_plen_37_part_01
MGPEPDTARAPQIWEGGTRVVGLVTGWGIESSAGGRV